MKIKNYTSLSFIYLISVSAYFLSSYGFFYKLRPYLYLIAFVLVAYDLFKNMKLYLKNMHPFSEALIPVFFVIVTEFVSIFYSYDKFISLQLFVTNVFLLSTLIIYLSNMDPDGVVKFFRNIIILNGFIYFISIIMLIFDYRLATITRFGFYTFSGIFYAKQLGIVSLITIFSIDVFSNYENLGNTKLKSILRPLYIASVLFIILSFSRAVFIALIIYWGILMILKKKIRKYILFYILLITFLVLLFIVKPYDNIIKYTVTDRQYFINYAIHIYKQYIIKGNGYGCGKFLTILPKASHYLRHDLMGKQFHNSYLEIYFDTGLFGLVSFVWMIVILFKRTVKYKMFFLMAMIVPILFDNLFTSSLAYPSSPSYFFSYVLIIYGLVGEGSLMKTENTPDS